MRSVGGRVAAAAEVLLAIGRAHAGELLAAPTLFRAGTAQADIAPPISLEQYASHGHVLGFDSGGYVSNGTYALPVTFDAAAAIAPSSDDAARDGSEQQKAAPHPDPPKFRYPRALAVLAMTLAFASAASSQVTTENTGSILFFPKIVSNAERDTFVQLANSSNGVVFANCFYVSGGSEAPLDFRVSLAGQRPTRWVASKGRDPQEPASPGTVPAVSGEFAGALICVETDAAGTPVGGNHVYGYATIAAREGGDVAEYNAVELSGSDCAGQTGSTLILGVDTGDCGIPQYGACPSAWVLDHAAEGSEVPQIGTGSSVHTDLTILPCSLDLAAQTSPLLTIDFEITTELEERFSASTTVTAWLDAPLGEISEMFEASNLGAASVQTRITSPAGEDGGFVVVAEEFRQTGDAEPVSASAAVNAHAEGMRADPDHIVLPEQ